MLTGSDRSLLPLTRGLESAFCTALINTMRKLGVSFGIYVPAKFVTTDAYRKFTEHVAAAAGGMTATPVDGIWVDKLGTHHGEPIVIVEARATEFDYPAYSKTRSAMHDFGRYMLMHGEQEVMRTDADKAWMQQPNDR